MKQELHFTDNKTYFGIDIHRYGVKVDDLEKLPFLIHLLNTMKRKYS